MMKPPLNAATREAACAGWIGAGYRSAVGRDRWAGLAGLDRAPTLDAVLLPLDGPGVVPPAALAHGHRQVGLLGPGLELVKDRRAELRLVGRQRLGIGVLGVQVGDGLRALLVGE